MEDVRCLLTMAALGISDKDHVEQAKLGVYFFSGRLSARAGFDIVGAMKAEAPKMSGPDFQAEFKRCGPMIATETQTVQTGLNGLHSGGPPPPGAAPGPAPKK